MVTDFEELVALCDEELRHREYHTGYYERIIVSWNNLRLWMENHQLSSFSEEVGNRYCDEILGTHLMPRNAPAKIQEKIRAVRMLISYQKNGDFEFRCPSVEYIFEGEIGIVALKYLEYCKNELTLSQKTIENKRLYLRDFSNYLTNEEIIFDALSVDVTESFFKYMHYSLASRHNASVNIRIFLRYAYDNGYSNKDASVYILPDSYRKNCKLPTTYEEDEIRALIQSVERASAIGKRDYLILLLAVEYGWRAKDITKFTFDDINWDKNVICFDQHKTSYPVEFPLLSTIGNAIIDYLKYARPESNVQEIIVSMENPNKGKPLSSPTIHSVVSKYLSRAEIKNWKNKKHGPHAMRHSLAANLLKKNVAMPIISTVMGHQKTETTSIYISVDYEKLKLCAIPMPLIHSPFYKKEGADGKI